MSYSEKVSNELNRLLTKNYDAEAGYKKAAETVNDARLKDFFKRRAEERYQQGHALKAEIRNFGQEPDKGTSFTGDAHRFWMDIKSTLGNTEERILEEAIRGEKASIEDYNEVIKNNTLPPSTENLLMKQRNAVEKALVQVQIFEITA